MNKYSLKITRQNSGHVAPAIDLDLSLINEKLDLVGARHQHKILDNIKEKGISDIEILNVASPATIGVAKKLNREMISLLQCETISLALKSRLIEGLEIKEVNSLTSYEITFSGVMDNSSRGVELFFLQKDGSFLAAPFKWQEHAYGHGDSEDIDNSSEFEEFIAEHISDNAYIISLEWDESVHFRRDEYKVKRVVLN